MDDFVFHHVGIAVRDMHRGIANYKDLFGYELTSGPFDDPIQKVSVCFLRRQKDDTVLELVAALGPNSPVDRIVKRGGGTYHICYEVADLKAAINHMTSLDCLLLTEPVPAVAFGMRQIAWLLTESDLLVELLQT